VLNLALKSFPDSVGRIVELLKLDNSMVRLIEHD